MPWRLGSLFAGIGGFDLAAEQTGSFETVWQVEINPQATQVLAHHWPEVLRHGDITTLDPATLPPADVVCGGSPCFPAGTLVLTKRGLVPIETVVIGDEVLTHLLRWRPVLDVIRRKAPTLTLQGMGHYDLRTTADHPFYARTVERRWRSTPRGYDRVFGEPEWTAAADLVGKQWSSPARFPDAVVPDIVPAGREKAVPPFSEAFFWLVGAWLGDGWTDLHQRPHRRSGQLLGNVLIGIGFDDAQEFERHLSETQLHFRSYRERTTMRYVISSRPLARWLRDHFGQYSHGKRLPFWVLGMRREWRRALWDGYMWTDGFEAANGMSFSSTSKPLIVGMRLLSQSLGMVAGMYNASRPRAFAIIEGRTVAERPSYSAKVYWGPRSSVNDGDYAWGRVRRVAPTGHVEEVYNLEVSDDNSYTADGMVVHNCQNLSVAGHRDGLAGDASRLFWDFVRVADAFPQAPVVWENVPGVLSSHGGDDFALVLWGFTGFLPAVPAKGWRSAGVCQGPRRTVAWRVLDSQYFGVAQRRRRVFLVGYPGHDPRAVEVLFDAESVSGNPPPRRQAGALAPTLLASGAGTNRPAGIGSEADFLIPVTQALTGRRGVDDNQAQGGFLAPMAAPTGGLGNGGPDDDPQEYPKTYTGFGVPYSVPVAARAVSVGRGSYPTVHEDLAPTITGRHGDPGSVAYTLLAHTGRRNDGESETFIPVIVATEDLDDGVPPVAHTLSAEGADASEDGTGRSIPLVAATLTSSYGKQVDSSDTNHGPPNLIGECLAVRTLLPIECERLQGFPDRWTCGVSEGDTPISDSARYCMLGNAVTVPVVRWIFERLARAGV